MKQAAAERKQEAAAAASSQKDNEWAHLQKAIRAQGGNAYTTLTTTGATESYQPTVVTSGTTAMNFSGAQLMNR